LTISCLWLVRELKMFDSAAKRAIVQILGSFRVSINCVFLKCLFSTPVWLILIRSTAKTRSSGVRNRAVVGESGKKNQKTIATTNVINPVISINHCQGMSFVLVCKTPKLTKPKKMIAKPFIRNQ